MAPKILKARKKARSSPPIKTHNDTRPSTMPQNKRCDIGGSKLPLDVNIPSTKVPLSALVTKKIKIKTITTSGKNSANGNFDKSA